MTDFQYIKKMFEENLGVECSISQINKPGGVAYTGLTIVAPGSVHPIFNLDELRERGLSEQEMVAFIADRFRLHQMEDESGKKIVSCLRNYEEAKKHLALRCCNLPNNISYLEDKPYRMITGDIAAYLIVNIGDLISNISEGIATTSVTHSLLKNWGVSFEEAYGDALNNGFQPYIGNIGDMLDEMYSNEPDNPEMQEDFFSKDFMQPLEAYELIQHMSLGLPSMFVISNPKRIGGGSILAYPEALKMLSDFFAMDLMVLPSSIHEILVVPYESLDIEEISSMSMMVTEVNETSVAEEDILSSTAYVLRDGVLLDIQAAQTA